MYRPGDAVSLRPESAAYQLGIRCGRVIEVLTAGQFLARLHGANQASRQAIADVGLGTLGLVIRWAPCNASLLPTTTFTHPDLVEPLVSQPCN